MGGDAFADVERETQGEHDDEARETGYGSGKVSAEESLPLRERENVIDHINVEGAIAGVNRSQVGAPASPDDDFTAVGTDVVAVAPGVGGDEVVGVGRLGEQVVNGVAQDFFDVLVQGVVGASCVKFHRIRQGSDDGAVRTGGNDVVSG